MPTYDYRCDACGHAFETFHSIKAEPLRKCPECGKRKLQRLLGAGGGFIFKGSGFYITDYRSDSYRQAAKAEQGGGTNGNGQAGSEALAGEKKAAEKSSAPEKKTTSASKAKQVK